ncbi:uncharacterized protein LOC119729155 isoform X2 [Patiria miniata]|nr:uncharacterized protein LOC119729155 isoform X2 [Patiria miniata]
MVVVDGNEDTKKIEGLCLFHFGPSNASQKVRACLEAKKLKWQSRVTCMTSEEMESDWYFTIHPQGLVPALVHDGVTHIESSDIMVYLDEAFPEIPLRPNTVDGRQAVQSWLDLERTIQKPMKYMTFRFYIGNFAKLIETDKRLARLKEKNPEGYAFHKMVREGSWNDEDLRGAIEEIHDALQILEGHLANHEWLVGDQISLADYCWGTNVYRYVESYMYRFPMGRYPAVRAWYKRLLTDEAFQKAVVAYGGGPPKPLLAIKNSIQEFLGNSISCFERDVKPNWARFVLMTVAVPLCFAFLPYASTTAATGLSSTVINTGLAALWASVLYSCYKKAHAATKTVYFSSVHRMRALLTKAYGSETPVVCEEHPRPKVVLPDDILVRVHAASINPIDVKIREGYGKRGLNFMRGKSQMPAGDGKELPLIQGRDCSGVVEAVGEAVSKVKVGDEVWASLSVAPIPGTYAEYVLLKEGLVSQKPSSLTHVQSAALGYVAMTTWGALVKTAVLGPDKTAGKRVLILAGTGGIGSFAIQLVKAWGGHVTTSCSTSGIEMVEKLGADEVVDYRKTDLESALKDKPRFDVVLDTLGPAYYQTCLNLTKRGGCVVTLDSPALKTLDQYGFLLGLPKALYDLFRISIPQKLFYGRSFKYGFVAASADALDVVASLVEQKKIQPIVEKVYSLEDGNEALGHVQKGHARGKTVLLMKPE